jgi:hypothetical protein
MQTVQTQLIRRPSGIKVGKADSDTLEFLREVESAVCPYCGHITNTTEDEARYLLFLDNVQGKVEGWR